MVLQMMVGWRRQRCPSYIFWNLSVKMSFISAGSWNALVILQQSWLPLSSFSPDLTFRMNSEMNFWQFLLISLSISIKNLPKTLSILVAQASFQCGQSSFLRFSQQSLIPFKKVKSSLVKSLLFLSLSFYFCASGKNLFKYRFNCSTLLLSSIFSMDSISSSSLISMLQFQSLLYWANLVNSGFPLCLVLTWVQSAGQLRYDFPQLQEKLRPSSSFRVLLLRLRSSLSRLQRSLLEARFDSLIPAMILYLQNLKGGLCDRAESRVSEFSFRVVKLRHIVS